MGESKKYEDEQDATGKIEIVDEEQTTQNVQEGNTENPAGELDDKERKYDDHETKDQINNDMHEEPQDEGGDEDQGYEKEKERNKYDEEDGNNEGEEENEEYEGRKYNEQVIYKADGGGGGEEGKGRLGEDIEVKNEQSNEEESMGRKGKEQRR